MTSRLFRRLAVAFDAAVVGLSALVYGKLSFQDLPDYGIQLETLTVVSVVLTLCFLVGKGEKRYLYTIIILRTLIFALMTVTVPLLDLRFLPATLSFAVLVAFHASFREIWYVVGFWTAVILVVFFLFPSTGGPRFEWGWDLLLYLVSAAAVQVCAAAVRGIAEETRRLRRQVIQLRDETGRLADANLGFQQYASLLEQETTRAERLRLSREIHDSAGYALTTLKMLFEAAKGLIVKDPTRLDKLMDEGAKISQDALQEIRFVLHELRSKEETLPEGMRLVVLLVRNFEKVCGVSVRLELTNTRSSYGHRIDSTLYRMVQEGMTNAFHHGRATRITIILSEVEEGLSVRIRDNGTGAQTVKKGIGLNGMEERVAEAGGWMHYQTGDHGFEISAQIPLQEES